MIIILMTIIFQLNNFPLSGKPMEEEAGGGGRPGARLQARLPARHAQD